jgi:menaquinone-dependent protoporphyrinogen oxidase
MANIIIVYATTDGHTHKICRRLQTVIEAMHHQVELLPITEESGLNLGGYDKIVIGASIRYGKHSPLVYDFISKHQQVLESKPNAFFTVNVVARKPEKNQPETNPYLKKFLKQIAWMPAKLGVFAGRINYQMYGFRDRVMIRFIMWITKGPTDPQTDVEFTDWDRVEAFGREIADL